MSQELLDALAARGMDALSKLACAEQPPAFGRFLDQLVPRLPLARVAVAKRLLFEAHTYLIHSRTEKIEASDATSVRKINSAEGSAPRGPSPEAHWGALERGSIAEGPPLH